MQHPGNIPGQDDEQKGNTFAAVISGPVRPVYGKRPSRSEANQHYNFKYTHNEQVETLLLPSSTY
ncbi:hypothetical protein ACFLX8_01605 [Chloroflexota bacterium]